MLFGSDPKWLLLGIMMVTGFLSLWIQNTAAASMMLPIVAALVKQVAKYNKAYSEPGARSKSKISQGKHSSNQSFFHVLSKLRFFFVLLSPT